MASCNASKFKSDFKRLSVAKKFSSIARCCVIAASLCSGRFRVSSRHGLASGLFDRGLAAFSSSRANSDLGS